MVAVVVEDTGMISVFVLDGGSDFVIDIEMFELKVVEEVVVEGGQLLGGSKSFCLNFSSLIASMLPLGITTTFRVGFALGMASLFIDSGDLRFSLATDLCNLLKGGLLLLLLFPFWPFVEDSEACCGNVPTFVEPMGPLFME